MILALLEDLVPGVMILTIAAKLLARVYISSQNRKHAFVSNGITMTDLGTLGGLTSSGFSINNSGQVVGRSDTTNSTFGPTHAFISDGITMTDLGTLGGDHSSAHGINDSGQVVGSSRLVHPLGPAYVGPTHAFISDGITMTDLGTLGGGSSNAYAINNNGQVVGASTISGSTAYHAFIISNSNAMVDLGTLGGRESRARGVNDSGHVVGWSQAIGGVENHAFISDGITMTDLNTLLLPGHGWDYLATANDINKDGQITGYGIINFKTHAFLMTPIPEPATLILLAIGGMAAVRRKRR